MHPNMLLLAERLVIAMETMSQDVRNMSAYVYDISCSVSNLLNEKREKDSISVVAYDEPDNPPPVSFGQYEQDDERASSDSENVEKGESCFGDIAPRNIDLHENSDALCFESNSVFPGRIKIEEQAENEVNEESHDTHNMYENSKNNVTISKEMRYETQWETEGEEQAYGLHTTISPSLGQSMPSVHIATRGFPSYPVPGGIPCVETTSNFTVDKDHTTLTSKLPEGQTSVAGTSQMQSAKDNLMTLKRVDSKKRAHKCSMCGKSFKLRTDLQRHTRIHTGERPYKCNVCGKAFSLNGNLTKHMPSHTGERPFSCKECGKAFIQKSNLTYHMGSHKGGYPY